MKKILFLVIILFQISCSKEDIDKDILKSGKMIPILIDIHIAEAKVNHMGVSRRDSSAAVYLALQDEVFKKHGVTKEVYIKSFRFYNSRPDLMDKIYEAVVDSLNVRQKLIKVD